MTEAAPLTRVFTLERIEKLCGVRAFARASMIHADEIEDLAEVDGRLTATVRGTMPYSVAVWIEGTRKAAWSCTCPQGDDGKFCKHAGAVALTLHGGGRGALSATRAQRNDADIESDPVFDLILGLDHDELARLVYDAATRDRRTAQRLETKAAELVGAQPVDVKEQRKAITAAFGRPSRFVDYYEAPRWAERVNSVLDELRALLDDGHAEAVIPLSEYAFERADKATQYVDGSDGWFGTISDDIADLHLRACSEARPDPVALARRLVEFDLHAELDTFRRAAATYADILGSEGLAEYRRLVEPAFDALGPRTDRNWSERFHLTEAMLGLAWATDDADEVIRIRSADLRSPYDYGEIVAILRRVGRTDEAIDWAHRGIDMPGRHFQTRELREQLVEMLQVSGDPAAAHAVRVESFHASPSLVTFKQLLDGLSGDERGGQRTEALDWLRERAITTEGDAVASVLVEILLYDGEIDHAWEVATTLGCSAAWWMTLARAREADHPADAIPIYRDAIAELIDRKQSKHYKGAVDLMARIQRLHAAIDDEVGWNTYLDEVVETHRRKSNLMGRIRDQGWA